MPRYMLDTDISSYVMKRTHPHLLLRLQRTQVSDVCISVITKAELMFGVEISPRQKQDKAVLDEFLRYVEVLDLPGDAAADCAQIRGALNLQRAMIGANDLFIAAHARCLGLTLVTTNTREFGRVRDLSIENWSAPGI